MIQWLIAAPFYAPLSFESGVLSGAISMTLSHVGFKLFKFFNPTNTDTSISFLRTMRKIVSPIREIELFLHGGFESPRFWQEPWNSKPPPTLANFTKFWPFMGFLGFFYDFKLNSRTIFGLSWLFTISNSILTIPSIFKTTSHKTKTTDTSQDSSSSFA